MQHRLAKRFEVVRDVLHPVVRGPSLKPCHRCSRLLCKQVIDAAPQCRGSASLLLGGSNSAQTVRRGHRWEPGRRTGGSTRHSPVCGPRGRRGKAPHYWPCSSDGDEAKNPAAHAGRTECTVTPIEISKRRVGWSEFLRITVGRKGTVGDLEADPATDASAWAR